MREEQAAAASYATGCEAITAQILDEARQAGERRIAEAQHEVQQMEEEARRQAAEQAQAILAQGKKEEEAILRAARSAAALTVRNAALRQRRRALDRALKATLEYLEGLPADEYFERLLFMLEKSVQPGRGILRFNERDLARLPADFDDRLRGLLHDKDWEGDIVVSGLPAAMDGGFVLQYGEVEIHASFSALAEEKREDLEDLFSRELFAG